MKQVYVILGIFTMTNIFGQEFNKFQYQLDLGTTFTIPYKETIERWPEFTGHPQTNYYSNFGYFVEFMISYNIVPNIVISSGLNYNYIRLSIDDKIGLTENKGNLTNTYLQIPIIFKYRISDKIPISIATGPYLGLLISANEKGTSYIDTAGFIFSGGSDPTILSINPIQKYDSDIKTDYATIDFGLSLQFDYEKSLSKSLTGVLFTRFNYGLKNVITNALANKNTANEWENYNFMIGFGVKL